MDKKFVIVGFIFAVLGLCLGIVMAASKNHGQFVTHAHILLIGFVLSFIYGLCHKLWLTTPTNALAKIQFLMHVLGACIISVGLFLLYGNYIALETIDPILALGSISVLIACILMLIMLIKSCKHS